MLLQWIVCVDLHADGFQNVHTILPAEFIFTKNEPGTTIHKIFIFKLLLIHVINKLGVYYYKRFLSKRLPHMLATKCYPIKIIN